VLSPEFVALLLGSIVLLGTAVIVFALMLRGQWDKMSEQTGDSDQPPES
jgi:cell division septation protein DedD